MASDEPGFLVDDAPATRRRWSPTRLAAWAVALVVFEVTMDPSLAVIVGCSKFGWEPWRTAWWLRREDPDRARGRACGWLYLSWGLWRVSLVATVLMFALVQVISVLELVLGAPMKPRGKAPPVQFIAAALLSLGGALVSSLATVLGLASARKSGARIWVGPEAIAARKAGTWPPRGPARKANRFGLLLFASIPFLVVFVGFPLLGTFLGLAFAVLKNLPGPGVGTVAIGAASLVLLIAMPIVLLARMDAARRDLAASRPEDCWGLPGETPSQDPWR